MLPVFKELYLNPKQIAIRSREINTQTGFGLIVMNGYNCLGLRFVTMYRKVVIDLETLSGGVEICLYIKYTVSLTSFVGKRLILLVHFICKLWLVINI